MIVDAHFHVFVPHSRHHPRQLDPLPPAERAAPVTGLLPVMERTGVDRAVLVPLGPEDDYVAVGTFSKTYAMTGLRVGYAVVPPVLAKLQEPIVFGPSGEGRVRLSLATDLDALLEGARRLSDFTLRQWL
ncbi:MAG TPA: aminotransferase class I/II-fold pyridoxal phosphate-dependent enzyme [Actinoallomurus sp.]|jgi:hypothetical protein